MVLELQDKRDKYCNDWTSEYGSLLARYDGPNTQKWRCYCNEALTRDRRHYDKVKASICYFSVRSAQLQNISNEGKLIYSTGHHLC